MSRRALQVGDRVAFRRKHVQRGEDPRGLWEVEWEPRTTTVGLGHGRFARHDEVLLRRVPGGRSSSSSRKSRNARVGRLKVVQSVEERMAEELMR